MINNKKTIEILTFHKAINYGAVWQCYALVHFLEQNDYEVSVIDYYPDFSRKQHHHLPKRLRNFLIKISIIPQFNKFVRNNFTLSERYNTIEEIRNKPIRSDYVICGSDQIWNYEIVGKSLPIYLLDFISSKSEKIAYATSIGGNLIDDDKKETFMKALSKYKAISVREKIAQNEIEKLTAKPVQLVLDPTFLIDSESYKQVMSNRFKNKSYILVIDLEKNDKMKRAAVKLQKETNLPILNISGLFLKYAKNPLSVTPEDWLSAIYYAKYVCVNSFHGLVFSLLFNKNFYYIERIINDKNNRALDLLNLIKSEKRFIDNIDQINPNEVLDYTIINEVLSSYIEEAKFFLINNCK